MFSTHTPAFVASMIKNHPDMPNWWLNEAEEYYDALKDAIKACEEKLAWDGMFIEVFVCLNTNLRE